MYRFAPSPTGDMHIGNLRAAIFNYICSLQDKSGFILRIEDTDNERNIDGKEKEIVEILAKFGITPKQIYIQSENLKFHRQLASKLLIDKKAFACFCTQEELEAKKEQAKNEGRAYRYDGTCERMSDEEVLACEKPFVIRMKKPKNTMKFTDAIKGELSFEPEAVDSFVIMRADKTPTYNFACAVDDMLEGVTFVIRGEDHVSNTPKQDLIREGLGYTQTMNYAHLPIILNEEGKKMSKRDDASSVKWMLQSGFMPEAIANYLILLGNKTPVEIFTITQAAQWFDISKISRSPAKFDMNMLKHVNREHIKLASPKRLSELTGLDENRAELIKFYTQESSLLPEIKEKIEKIFSQKVAPSEYEDEFEILKNSIKILKDCQTYDEFKNELMQSSGLKGKKFFMPLRALLTGELHGPELSELYPLIKTNLKEIAK
ncbi:glutamate--tRNA ligase [Campylobacter sp. RM9344]|uniref:Glutamate--tRNA ligase n=1 Tax=Campylobacter californiensis TaxID=1032243 RepID=A0AAW3ZVP1_9BACT|nr:MULTISPECIES: glutamate--tRNA ligase [unclassified Campylobacter]MBE2984713.1 glutamate--tRNA ligase [Campylobacter sp. RM6883]MBE2986903.1 glutamate--tRNA ligase [Campylobacter sp. RM12919]MBE2987809.1 glutamate--tRNA ligase [Campylobacter sp. RM12920]MBE2994629.1 glutamate--tRNA ligase [Campylobacter sp. RM6913]MBE3029155.1 glutamate--tRNA ligase [Campylobacter sp. RM9344]